MNGEKPTYEELERRCREAEEAVENLARTEGALRGERERLQFVIEGSRQGFWEWNIQTGKTVFNATWAEMLGYTLDELTPYDYRTWERLVHPEDVERAKERLALCIEGKAPDYECEFRMKHKDGDWVWILDRGRVMTRDAEGMPLLMFGTHTDITERKRAEEESRHNRNLLRTVLDIVPAYLCAKNLEGRFLLTNKKLADFYHTTVEALTGILHGDVCNDAEELKSMLAADRQVIESGRPFFIPEETMEDPDGNVTWLETHKIPFVTHDEPAVLIVALDITERKRAEEGLRKSEEKYRELFETAPIGIFRTNSRGEVLSINTCMARILGFGSPEDALANYSNLGKQLYVREERRKEFLRVLQAEGQVENFEYEARTFDGGQIWLSMNARIQRRDADGTFTIGAFTTDVTERKRAEEALRESEERFRHITENSTDVIWHLDGNYCFDYISPADFRMRGFKEEEVLGTPIWNLLKPEGIELVKRRHAERMEDERKGIRTGAIRYELELVNKAGGSIWAEINVAPHRDPSGNIVGLYGVTRDISERKRAEEERERLQAQLTQSQKMESVGRLAGGVAHDFNNMLNVILGHADLALEDLPPDSPFHANLQEIQKAAQRSADLTRQLLAFARKQTVAPRVLDLNETIHGMLKMLQRLIGEDIDLAWRPGAEIWPIKVDPSQIDQILANLCVNARDAIGGVGKITIETGAAVFDAEYCAVHAGYAPGEYTSLVVSDNGCGMNAETLSHLFEPFFTTKGVGEGTGLGLATVYGIVRQNEGFVHVYSEPGQGTTFRIYLPRHAGKMGQGDGPGAAEAPVRGHETILLVEDEPSILSLTTKMLERLGYDVLAASSPGEAVRLAREHAGEIHLLMTDVVMPEMNGRDLARNILSIYPHIKRLFMSGYTADVIAHHGVLDEGVHFIQKPFSLKNLAAKTRETLDEA